MSLALAYVGAKTLTGFQPRRASWDMRTPCHAHALAATSEIKQRII